MKNNQILVFTGYNPRAVIAFLRELTACRVPFQIAAASSEDPILRSQYKEHVFAIRKKRDLDLEEILEIIDQLKVQAGLDGVIILPSTEYLNRFLLRNREVLLNAGAMIPLVDESLYCRISDKETFAQICAEAGLKIPRELPLADVKRYPVVAKPRRYTSGDGQVLARPALIYSQAELERFMSSNALDEFLVQEFAYGRSFYLLYYFAENGEVVRSSQENFAQQKNGGSIVAAVAAELHHTPIADDYERLFLGLGFRGLVMVEIRGGGNEWWMIEANPRLWGPSQLFVDAGVPIFRRFLSDLGFSVSVKSRPPVRQPTRYFWVGGMGADEDVLASVDLHGCEPDKFRKQFRDYLVQDVYLRPDTLKIFHDELKKT